MDINKELGKISKINEDKLYLLTLNDSFIEYAKECRKQIGIPIEGYNEEDDEKEVEELYTTRPDKVSMINTSVGKILRKYKLSKNYAHSILHFLLYNEFNKIPVNFVLKSKGKSINIEIYKNPSKQEWNIIKKSVSSLIAAASMKTHRSLKRLDYPDGVSVSKPKPRLHRNLEILEKSKYIGEDMDDEQEWNRQDVYRNADIEAEVFPENNTAQAKKNITNIKVIKHRYKRYTKGTT